LIASSAKRLQCSLTGGSLRYEEISVFFIFSASSIVIPFNSSVAYAELAMTDPHPKALNTAYSIFPSGPILTCIFNKSPQATEPTVEVPT